MSRGETKIGGSKSHGKGGGAKEEGGGEVALIVLVPPRNKMEKGKSFREGGEKGKNQKKKISWVYGVVSCSYGPKSSDTETSSKKKTSF